MGMSEREFVRAVVWCEPVSCESLTWGLGRAAAGWGGLGLRAALCTLCICNTLSLEDKFSSTLPGWTNLNCSEVEAKVGSHQSGWLPHRQAVLEDRQYHGMVHTSKMAARIVAWNSVRVFEPTDVANALATSFAPMP